MNVYFQIVNTDPKQEVSADKKDNASSTSISDEDLKRLAYIEFKSQSYASFYNTSMEKDKSILTLSVAGLGFLVTLLNLSKEIGKIDYALFILAASAFLVSIYCIVTMFGKNADFIIDLTQDKDVTLKEYKLKKLDTWAIGSFYLAIVASISLGISTSIPLIQ
ncbi:hypothetical protein [Aeromonas sp. R4-2]|uniref:hypothetical protein n=1 Tax=Aeromonas sp. R4-2 TaxID=3138465 RepID=UPI0034A2083B